MCYKQVGVLESVLVCRVKSRTMAAAADAVGTPITLEQCYVVRGDGTRPWIIKNWETVDGLEFLELKRSDRHFAAFVVGDGIGGIRDHAYLDELRKLRNDAQVNVLCNVNNQLQLFEPGAKSTYKLKKERAKAKQLGHDPPAVVSLNLPAVSWEGQTYDAIVMKVKGCKDYRGCISIELNATNLGYVRAAMLVRGKTVQSRKRKQNTCESQQDCKWVPKRMAYICKAVVDGIEKFVTVRATSSDEFDISTAREKAVHIQRTGELPAEGDCDVAAADDADDQDADSEHGAVIE